VWRPPLRARRARSDALSSRCSESIPSIHGSFTTVAVTGSTGSLANSVYLTGDKVSYQGNTYQAQWYTANQLPTTRNGHWKLIA
jgi:hypothetical protein